ncbi:MAG: ABC transporter ATP-binding protein [Lachnospiraceae bacterium]|nr:ABC transporter ATP-binding protein [Lachnospiraceae bacterium]MBQ8548207.1 ABC transporter ATP-binding protein [Lachnospiraceae bacterium]MBQ8845990.1 ABC transporter ATP-binding protein [Lachnospiraceae bacterium]
MAKNKEQKKTAKEDRQVIKRTLKFMVSVAWKERPSLFVVYAILFVAQLIQKAQIVVLPKFLIDELMLIVGGAPATEHLQNVVLYVALICGSNLLANVMSNVAFQWRSVLEEWFNEYFEVRLAEHTMQMDFEHTEDPEALDQLNRAKEGISWYSGGVVGVLNSVYALIGNIAVLLGVSTIILVTCPLLLPVQILGLVLISIFNAKNNKIEIESYKDLAGINRIFGYFLFQLADFSYGKEIRLYDSAEMMLQKTDVESRKMAGVWTTMAEKQCKNAWAMDVVNAARDGISYFYIGLLALLKKISVGDFSMCITSASELYQGMIGVVQGCQDIAKRCVYAHQFIKLLEYPVALEKGDKKVTGEKHVIEFSHVSFKYPRSEQYVLKDINLKITSGEHLSVVGLNGAGKTTFIKLLCRLYDVTEGEILIDGINIKEYSEEEYRKLFAVVFQDFQLFAFSLKDNIALGDTVREDEVNRVLELSGFYEDAQKLPQGLDTMLYKSFDEKGTELSGGQQQKTAIARALYKNAPIVILDEPTAALDPVAEYDIYRRFDTLVGGKTAIYISHRLSSCKFCDRIAVFAENTIKEYGTHEELVDKKNGIYAELFAAQAQYYVEAV